MLNFFHYLRREGVNCSVVELIDSLNSLNYFNTISYYEMKLMLKITMIKNHSDYFNFETLFNQYISNEKSDSTEDINIKNDQVNSASELNHVDNVTDESNSKKIELAIYSPLESKNKRILTKINDFKKSDIKHNINYFLRKFPTKKGRRYYTSKFGNIDIKYTVKHSLNNGGMILKIFKHNKKLQRNKVVILFDISGSMDSYTEKILHVLYYMKRSLTSSEVFAFNTDILRLSPFLNSSNVDKTFHIISENLPVWGSGTKIGLSLKLFFDKYNYLIDDKTLLLIISDGWDIGNINLLQSSLSKIKNKINKLFWINPLIDNKNYEPLTKGIVAAMPYIDYFISPKVFEDRNQLIKYFGKQIRLN